MDLHMIFRTALIHVPAALFYQKSFFTYYDVDETRRFDAALTQRLQRWCEARETTIEHMLGAGNPSAAYEKDAFERFQPRTKIPIADAKDFRTFLSDLSAAVRSQYRSTGSSQVTAVAWGMPPTSEVIRNVIAPVDRALAERLTAWHDALDGVEQHLVSRRG